MASSSTSWSPDLLLGHPSEMLLQQRIAQKTFWRGAPLGKGHFIVDVVNPVMALTTDGNPSVAFFPRIGLLEAHPSVDLFGDQVVKGQGTVSPAEGTNPVFFPAGVTARCQAGHAQSLSSWFLSFRLSSAADRRRGWRKHSFVRQCKCRKGRVQQAAA